MQESRTKTQLDQALRTLLREKSPDQIRVRELTELCGIRRQSFYYHFTDVFDLFSWSVDHTGAVLAARQDSCLTWQQAFRDLLAYLSENQAYCQAVRSALGRPGLRHLLGGAVDRMLANTSDYYRRRCGGGRGAGDVRQSACDAAMVLGLLDSWICGDLPQSPEDLTARLDQAVRQGMLGAVWQNLPLWGGAQRMAGG